MCSFEGGLPGHQGGKATYVRIVAALCVALAFTVAGCGGDDGEATNGTSSQETFAISESDFTLTPPTVTIEGPGTYTFEATNDGGVDHSLEIEGNGVDKAGPYKPDAYRY